MDVVSHAIWGRHITHTRVNWKAAALIGVLPDLCAFIPGSIVSWVNGNGGNRVDNNTVTADFPEISWQIYTYSHSLIWAGVIFAIIWYALSRKVNENGEIPVNRVIKTPMCARNAAFFLMLPWFFHILVDIPVHTAKFFPTPFLSPLSDYVFGGIRWSTPWIWWSNVVAIIFVAWLLYRNDPAIEVGDVELGKSK